MASPQLMDASNAEQVLACAELIAEDCNAIPYSRENVDQLKATLRQLARQSNSALRTTALWWLIFHVGETVATFQRAWQRWNAQRR